jgi:hypothetical protein
LIIVPKISENDFNLKREVIDVIQDKIEIQMTSKDLEKSFHNSKHVIDKLLKEKSINEIVFHMPFSFHTFELFVSSTINMTKVLKFIHLINDLSIKYDIKIGILLHQENSLELIDNIPNSYDLISEVLNFTYNNKNIYYLIENCLPYLNCGDIRVIHAFELLNRLPHDNLFCCIDVCHIRIQENIFRTNITIPKNIVSRIKWIHFASDGGDGYINKETHSSPHKTKTLLLSDLKYLEEQGIDVNNTPLVAELTEINYSDRVNMLKEIKLLNSLNVNNVYKVS